MIGDPLLGGDPDGEPDPPGRPRQVPPDPADPAERPDPPAAPAPPDPLWAATVGGGAVVPADVPTAEVSTTAMPAPGAATPAAPGSADAPTTAMPAIGAPVPGPAELPTTAMPSVDAGAFRSAALPVTPAAGLPARAELPTTAMPAAGAAPAAAAGVALGAAFAGGHDTLEMPTIGAPAPGAAGPPAAPPGERYAGDFERQQRRDERRHRRRWWRRGCKLVGLLIVAAVVYGGVNLGLVLYTAHADQARPVDVLVVLGAAQYDGRPSPQLQARLDHTVDLWEQGLAPAVFVTGGNRPGDAHTEAESSRDYLVAHGVPAEAISMEDTGHSTWESLSHFAEVAHDRGWERVLLVTDPFHSLRTRLIAQELGFTAYTSPTRTSPVQGREELVKELKEAAGISLGRIIGFRRLWELTG